MSFLRRKECFGEESPFTSPAADLVSAVVQGSEHVILLCPHFHIHLDSRNHGNLHWKRESEET